SVADVRLSDTSSMGTVSVTVTPVAGSWELAELDTPSVYWIVAPALIVGVGDAALVMARSACLVVTLPVPTARSFMGLVLVVALSVDTVTVLTSGDPSAAAWLIRTVTVKLVEPPAAIAPGVQVIVPPTGPVHVSLLRTYVVWAR